MILVFLIFYRLSEIDFSFEIEINGKKWYHIAKIEFDQEIPQSQTAG